MAQLAPPQQHRYDENYTVLPWQLQHMFVEQLIDWLILKFSFRQYSWRFNYFPKKPKKNPKKNCYFEDDFNFGIFQHLWK